MLIPGHATTEGTDRYRHRFDADLPDHFRSAHGLWLSSIGLGTYLGEATMATDAGYRAAVRQAIESGINVIDTAINYRHQRSERAVGEALAELIGEGKICRDEVFVATKGGFLSGDGKEPEDASSYFQKSVIQTGLATPEDIAAGCHVMTPQYLENQIEASRQNLGLDTVDLYYVHNPETQLGEVDRPEFYRRLRRAFQALEQAVKAGKIGAYGAATWNAFRVTAESREHISLLEVMRVAEGAGGLNHHFRAVQLPFSLAMPEALLKPTQPMDGTPVPLLRLTASRDLAVFASASLLQGQLSAGLPQKIARCFNGLKKDSQRSIQFVRSTPGILCALVGMSRPEHVEENARTARVPPMTQKEYEALFAR